MTMVESVNGTGTAMLPRSATDLLAASRRPTIPASVLLGISSQVLLARMKVHPALAGIAVAEPSVAHQALAPPSIEIAQTYVELRNIIEYRALVGPPGHVSFGAYLDELGEEEMGVLRRSSVPSQYVVEFYGTPGTQIPEGTRLATSQGRGAAAAAWTWRELYAGRNWQGVYQGGPGDRTGTTIPNLIFRTLYPAEIGADGTGGALVECLTPGLIGNVPAGTINRFDGPGIAGVGSLTNPSGLGLVPGADIETDDEYRTRLLRYRRDPPNGANAAQFRLWAEQVPGVGRAECVRPVEPVGPQGQLPPRPGTVWVFVTGTDLIEPPEGPLASQAVVDAVQQYIAPRLPTITMPAASFPTETLPDDGAAHTVDAQLPTERMAIAGIWAFRPALGISWPNGGPPAGGTPVVTVSVFNVTDNLLLDGRPNGQSPASATRTFTAGELTGNPPEFADAAPAIEFYWDGTQVPSGKNIVVRLERSAAMATAGNGTITLENVWLTSTFSDPTHEGLAPVDDRVEVYAATPRPITVDVAVEVKPGWTLAGVQAWIENALRTYLKGLVFAGSAPPVGGLPNRRANDVLYGMIGAVLYGGCDQGTGPLLYYDPTSLRLNGGTTDVEIWTGDIATLGAVHVTAL